MKKLFILSMAILFCCAGAFAQQEATKKMDHAKMGKMHDGVMMKDGKLVMMENGKDVELTHDVTLKNGDVVKTDGTLQMKDGAKKTLKDGDCVSMSGKMWNMKTGHDKMNKASQK